MKATILLAACILCGESKLESEFTEASSPVLRSLSGTAVRNKQQDEVCSYEEIDMHVTAATCDPNYGQRYLDILLDCYGDGHVYTRLFIGSCSRNENGRFCFEFGLGILFVNNTYPLEYNCPYLDNYSNYECTDMCRAVLQYLKSNIRCCLNSYYNITDYARNLLFIATFAVSNELTG